MCCSVGQLVPFDGDIAPFAFELVRLGSAPKFPRPSVFNFLLRYSLRAPTYDTKQESLDMSLDTLRAMANGGMHDQLGGGFHRYSVDERWFVPHFEKMLYDQAQLALSYLEAFQITHDPFFAKSKYNLAKLKITARAVRGYPLSSSF